MFERGVYIPAIKFVNGISYLRNFILNRVSTFKIPYSAQIELTLRCNASCSFCSIHSISKNIHPLELNREMDTNQVKHIIDQISKLGVVALSFTGGEPTLRSDLPELINYTGQKKKMVVGLATNGSYLYDLLKLNGLKGLNYILVSLDFPSAQPHDKFRGLKLYDKVIKSIKLANSLGIRTIISTVVMKQNLLYLDDMCKLAKSLGSSIELYPCENISRDFYNYRICVDNVQELIPNLELWAKVVNKLNRKYKNVLTDPLSVQIIEKGGFGGNPHYYQNILRCHVAEAYLFVRYDGFVSFPCKIHPLVNLSALEYSLFDIYNSPAVKKIMKTHDGFSFCQHCRLGCAIVSSMPANWATLFSKYLMGIYNGNLT